MKRKIILSLLILFGFFTSTFEVRYIAFYFWLLSGLLVASAMAYKEGSEEIAVIESRIAATSFIGSFSWEITS